MHDKCKELKIKAAREVIISVLNIKH